MEEYGPDVVMPDKDEQALRIVHGLNETIIALQHELEEVKRQLKTQIEMHQKFVQALITEAQALNGKTEAQYVYPTIHGEIK